MRPWLAGLLLLVALPLGLRLPALGHGLPRQYVPDAHVVRNALGMAKDRDPIPPVERYSSYPYLLSYLLLPCYALQFALGSASGAWNGPQEFATHALEHPGDLFVVARLLVALFGTLTVVLVWRTAREAGLAVGAWAAAWLVATGLLHVHFSLQERPWVPLAFFLALAAQGAVRYATRGTPRALWLAGAGGGLAFATHQIGALGLGFVVLALACGPRGAGMPPLARRLRSGLVALGLFALLALVLGHPYLLRYGPTPAESVVGGAEGAAAGGIAIGGQRMLLSFSTRTFGRLAGAFLAHDPALLLLGLLGLPLALARRTLRPVALFALGWAALFLTYHNDHVRYLLPLAVLLAWPAGLAFELAWSRRVLRPPLVALLALPLVLSARLAWVLSREDTRAAGERLLAELGPEAVIAIDRYGPQVELSRAALERLRGLRRARGEDLQQRERHRLGRLEQEDGLTGGVDALALEELLAFDERAGRIALRPEHAALGPDPRAALAALGCTHVLLAERHPASAGRDPSAARLGLGAALQAIDPASGFLAPPRECVLPMEMERPLVSLWQIARPGPRLVLHELEPRAGR